MGLATDYCVMHSVLDSVQEGFLTSVITDGCRGVGLKPDSSRAHIFLEHDLIVLGRYNEH